MKNNGFTLMELLAVIVVLAIIALIASPIVIGIINDSKEQANLRSAEMYIKAVSTSIIDASLISKISNATCEILPDGNLDCNGTIVEIKMDKKTATDGEIVFENGMIKDVQNLYIGETYYSYDENNRLVKTTLEETSASDFDYVVAKNINYTIGSTCQAVTSQVYSSMGMNANTDQLNEICTIGGQAFGLTLDDIFSQPQYLNMYVQYGAITIDSEEEINGVVILGYHGEDTDVVIPKIIEGKPVVEIAGLAFFQSTIDSLIIPSTVNTIRAVAFYMSEVETVKILGSINSIAPHAFSNCYNLTKITIPDSVKSIDYSAFYNCDSLTTIRLPKSLISIGDIAFAYCENLKEITIPASVDDIGAKAFEYCYRLEKVTFNANSRLTTIQPFTFYHCESLTSITLPNSVTSIDDSAFHSCMSLISITLPSNLNTISEDAFRNTGINSIIIPESVTNIGQYAFYSCTNLTDVIFEDTNGWSAGAIAISSEDLSSSGNAATYLKSTYINDSWEKSTQ